MKIKNAIFALLLTSAHAWSNTIIISDLDDTIKITNSANLRRGVFRSAFTKQVFAGLPMFFERSMSYANELHVVSAGPKAIKFIVENTLEENGIVFESVNLRNVLHSEQKLDYKVRMIEGILKKSSGKVILMGDDVELDPEVYQKVVSLFPDRVMATYIHVVRNRKVPAFVKTYLTSLDLAIHEHLAGRMDEKSVLDVLGALDKAEDLDDIFPRFAHCPKNWSPAQYADKAQSLISKIKHYCQKRDQK